MTKEEAIKTLKENCCAMCAYGSQGMDFCDIRSCDNMDAIKSLEQEPRWIPVSERLPEYSGNYLIVIADNDCLTVQFFEISWFYSNTHSWSYLNADVIAWMPLPEPYKTESEDQNEDKTMRLL